MMQSSRIAHVEEETQIESKSTQCVAMCGQVLGRARRLCKDSFQGSESDWSKL